MKKYFLMCFVAAAAMVGCSTEADDGVGLKPSGNSESNFYFRNGARHTITIEERQSREVTIENISDNFEAKEDANGGITAVKATQPTRLIINAYREGTYPITLTDGEKTAQLIVNVTPRDTGWHNGVYTIKDIDGDLTEENSTGYVEFETEQGFTSYDYKSIQPQSAQDRISVSVSGGMVRVTAQNHYDEGTPITFTLKNADGETRTVKVERVTKFWAVTTYSKENDMVYGLSNPKYITQNSFDKRATPPKMPWKAKYLRGYYGTGNPNTSSDVEYDIAGNKKITKVDLNNVEVIMQNYSWSSDGNRYSRGYGFWDCTNLKEVIAKNLKRIETTAAFGNTKLAKLELPAIVRIPQSTFYGSPITVLSLGKNLTTLEAGALDGMNGLQELRLAVVNPSQLTYFYEAGSTNGGFLSSPTSARLLVPSAALAEYNSRYPWLNKTFKGGVQGF